MFPIKIIVDVESNLKWFVKTKNISQYRYLNVVSVNKIKQHLENKHVTHASYISLLNNVISMLSNTTDCRLMTKYNRDIVRKPTYEEYYLLERYLRNNKLQYNKQKDELIQII